MPPVLSETLIWCVTLLLFGMGLIGTLIPMLPGIIIIAAGCIWQGIMGSHSLAWWEWTVLALLVAGAALGMLTGLLLEFTCGLLIIAWFCSCYFLF